jgi:hypothetical protein
MKSVLLVLALILAVAAQPKTPVWPVRFQQDFVESYTSTQYHDIGKLWYDSERNMERLDRNNGKYISLCNSITNATTPCTQLVRDGKRYIIFPLVRLCCFCCDSAHGCGIMRRDWLSVAGAKYVGKEELSGQIFDKWTETDSTTDYWATTDAKQVPRKHAEDNAFFKDFIMNTYSEEYIAESVFALPGYCTGAVCPETSACKRFRD